MECGVGLQTLTVSDTGPGAHNYILLDGYFQSHTGTPRVADFFVS